jgi:predicted nucleic acid-binding protein
VTYGIDTSFLVAVEVLEHPACVISRALLSRIIANGDGLALAPQVLAEFLHIVTDRRRFAIPFEMPTARSLAEGWWLAPEVQQILPDVNAMRLFFSWMDEHRLGRKRLLDTLLAATYRCAGVASLLTLNPRDFDVLGDFACLTPRQG